MNNIVGQHLVLDFIEIHIHSTEKGGGRIKHAIVREIFFFFQAEDGIRDRDVTGVQTCALPIYRGRGLRDDEKATPVGSICDGASEETERETGDRAGEADEAEVERGELRGPVADRSEERRVGKEPS